MSYKVQKPIASENNVLKTLKANSCTGCRKSKKKCDQKFPSCSLCTQRGRNCEYTNLDNRKPATKTYTNSLLDRIKVLEDAILLYKHENLGLKKKLSIREPSLNSSYSISSLQPSLPQLDLLSASTIDNSLDRPPDDIINLEELLMQDPNFEFDSDNTSNDSPHPYPLTSTNGFQLPSQSAHLKYYSKSSLDLKLPLLDDWKFCIPEAGGPLLFTGFTSMRYVKKPDLLNHQDTREMLESCVHENHNEQPLEGFHKQIFDWFFDRMENTLPLVNKDRFWKSINSSLEDDDLNIIESSQYVSISLINSIMAFYILSHEGRTEKYFYFKELATKQVDQDVASFPKINSVQVLLLLSILNMTEGNEIEASQVTARAVAVAYHLGIHVDSSHLRDEGIITEEESITRSITFWCCFVVDKLRGSIMGISPFIHCPDLSVKLPNANIAEDHNEKVWIDTFTETITFADTQCELLNNFSFDMRDIFLEKNDNEDKTIVTMGLAVSKALMSFSEWRRNMLSNSRFNNNKSLNAAFLEILQNVLKITLNKQLVREPLSFENLRERKQDQSSLTQCSEAAMAILKITSCYPDFSQSLFAFHFVFALHMACIIFLYNMTSSDETIYMIHKKNFSVGLNLLESNKPHVPAAEMYLDNLSKYQKAWNLDKDVND